MNFKLTVSLVVAMVILAAAFFLIPKMMPAKEVAKPGEATPLLSPKPSGIKTISFVRDGEQQVAFAHNGKDWDLTFPVQAKAESWQVDSVADSLVGLAYKDKFEAEATGNHSGAATGTEKPRYLVTFTDDSGKEYKLGLGKRTVGGIFATINGGKTVYLLASDPIESLDKPASDFRDKNIKEVNTEKVAALTIKKGDSAVTVTKSGDQWLVTRPIHGRANKAKVEEVLDQLKSIRATGFTEMAKDHPGTGLNPPQYSVTAMLENAPPTTAPATGPATATAPARTPVTLQIGLITSLVDQKNVYASIAGSKEVFTLDAKSAEKLKKDLQDLRDPAITPAMVGQATAVTEITNGKVAAKAVKKDGAWTLESNPAAPTPIKAGDLEVGDWLGDISHLRAIKFVDNAGDLKSIGLDPPVTRLEMTVPGQSQQEVILIGKPETADKVTPMMRQGEQTVYLVQTGDAQKAVRTELELRDKAVERLASTRIRAIRVSGPAASGGGIELVRQGTTWTVKSAGKSAKADDEKITSLLAELTPLTAAKYLAMDAKVSKTPDLTVTVTVAEEVAATAPATGPATAPATLPALHAEAAGPKEAKTVTRTLSMWKDGTSWKAVWDGAKPEWTFEPTAALVQHLTKESYAVAATQPSTQPAGK
jgi:hypothetical protein